MPFISRCTSAACRRFMLVEDEFRGQAVACLVCKQPFVAEVSDQDPSVRTCPSCRAKMRIPLSAASQKVRCPKCQNVF